MRFEKSVEREKNKTQAIVFFVCLIVAAMTLKCQAIAVNIPDQVTFCDEIIPLDHSDVRERLETQLLILSNQTVQVTLWLKRKDRYFPMIEKKLKERNLPDDLKYVAVIESSLIPRARSSQNALGLWQFMLPTARERGLEIGDGIDERLHIEKSTDSALDYLTYLYSTFGSWSLGLAAYNLGQGRVLEEIYTQGTSSYYEMVLPDETERYVFNAICAKLIFENPERYGFTIESTSPFDVSDSVEIEVRLINFVPVKMLAFCAGTNYRHFRGLNLWLTGVNLERGSHVLRIPSAHALEFSKKLAEYLEKLKGYKEFHGSNKVSVKDKGGNMRVGPGEIYPVFRELSAGTELRLNGRTGWKDRGNYWYIFKQSNGSSGWIWGGEITD